MSDFISALFDILFVFVVSFLGVAFIGLLAAILFSYPVMIFWNEHLRNFVHYEGLLQVTFWETFWFIFFSNFIIHAVTASTMFDIRSDIGKIRSKYVG